ncbi:MAG: hypothetical protein NBKEAIPA_02399 [Nitrospirae bacterium]|nr:MAG: putative glycosyltransferase, family 9 [Nitrospira sp. OLB3]MBV6470484.1 hypothetical protein [Nitrospirota bacterium]MCE7965642.1 hypothetical protein [Nitrospira sp. NTP2]MCK6494408.1 glycosyltransferase family 9 protein [Nitrospira sp.]MEB2338608.1 glycosyltransferase family 9 protein [Nitrospirales bacterium]
MQPDSATDRSALMIQLARLGDLVQSLPALEALCSSAPSKPLDVLCAAPLATVLSGARGIRRVIPWDGEQWRRLVAGWETSPSAALDSAMGYLRSLVSAEYDSVYLLNQHTRGELIARLFTDVTSETCGAADGQTLMTPWAAYLRQVATERGANRVHLADAWCGFCQVRPLGRAPQLTVPDIELPGDFASVGQEGAFAVALVTGAGDPARCVPPQVWAAWIRCFLESKDDGRVVLVGSGQEKEVARAISDDVPPLLQGRLWDATGRTSLPQLMALLGTCRWVVGGDTGPVHLAAALGVRVLGLYFARARVHETGPYGEGHWVFQHATSQPPTTWPVRESIDLLCAGRLFSAPAWQLWKSRLDRWGAFYESGADAGHAAQRAEVWRSLSPTLCGAVAA